MAHKNQNKEQGNEKKISKSKKTAIIIASAVIIIAVAIASGIFIFQRIKLKEFQNRVTGTYITYFDSGKEFMQYKITSDKIIEKDVSGQETYNCERDIVEWDYKEGTFCTGYGAKRYNSYKVTEYGLLETNILTDSEYFTKTEKLYRKETK